MAAFILGYRTDPAYIKFFAYAIGGAKSRSWKIEWSEENVELRGRGFMRFGQIKKGVRSEGMNIGLLAHRGITALKVAQLSDRRRRVVLFATAMAEQYEQFSVEEKEKGYAVIKDGRVPLLIEYQNAVLVSGSDWYSQGWQKKIAPLFEEIVRTFVFEEDAAVASGGCLVGGPDVVHFAQDAAAQIEDCG
jgi:hypothetical protein